MEFTNIENAIDFLINQFGWKVNSCHDGIHRFEISSEDQTMKLKVKDEKFVLLICNEIWEEIQS